MARLDFIIGSDESGCRRPEEAWLRAYDGTHYVYLRDGWRELATRAQERVKNDEEVDPLGDWDDRLRRMIAPHVDGDCSGRGDRINPRTVWFDLDSADIGTRMHYPPIPLTASELEQRPQLKYLVRGMFLASESDGVALSRARADVVKAALVELGARPDQVRVESTTEPSDLPRPGVVISHDGYLPVCPGSE